MKILLSRTQAGPDRTVKQEQEEISINNIQTFIRLTVQQSTNFDSPARKFRSMLIVNRREIKSHQNPESSPELKRTNVRMSPLNVFMPRESDDDPHWEDIFLNLC